jgi:hypothetical protein
MPVEPIQPTSSAVPSRGPLVHHRDRISPRIEAAYAGEALVPRPMVQQLLKAVVVDEAKAEQLTRGLGGCTIKGVAELCHLTIARDSSLTVPGLMQTRKESFVGSQLSFYTPRPERIIEFLQIVGVKNANRYKRTGWVISHCPLGPWNHENGKSGPEVFGVQIESGDPHCNCFACGFHGTLGNLVQRMFGLNKLQPKIEAKWGDARAITEAADAEFELDLDIPGIEEVMAANMKALHQFPEWWLDTFPPAAGSKEACNYLQKRDVHPHVIKLLDLRWDPNQRRICFPVRDAKQRLMGLHGRAIDENVEPRYGAHRHAKRDNPIVWLGGEKDPGGISEEELITLLGPRVSLC